MKKILLAILVLGVSTTMFGAACAPASDITSESNPCLAGNLNFSNFTYTHVQGASSFGPTALQQVLFPTGGNVLFAINPNQGNQNETQESVLTFVVTGIDPGALIIGASSGNGGNSNTDVHQVVCVGTVSAGGVCTGGAGATLEDIHTAGGIATPTQFFTPQTSVTVWRDSLTPMGSAMTGGSFDIQSAPEPVAMLLAGSGLALVGLLRRRRVV